MKNRRLTISLRVMLVALLIIFASFLRLFSFRDASIRSAVFLIIVNIYIALLAAWTISVQRRIMHRRVRHYLLMVSVSLLLHILIRIYKNGIFEEYIIPETLLYEWFYIPEIFAALFSFRAAQSLSLDENTRMSYKKKAIVGIPTHIISFLALTNELHGIVLERGTRNKNIGYFIIAIWVIGLSVATLHKVIVLSHSSKSKVHFERCLFVFSVTWMVLYAIDPSKRGFGFVEYVAIYATIIISSWESLIQLHIVPSNTEYKWCFTNSGIKAQIFDSDGKLMFRANNALKLDRKKLEEFKTSKTLLWDENTELETYPIIGGSVIWERDISEINGLIEELKETQDSISFASEILRERIYIEGRKHSLIEQNRLYDLIISNTDFQIALIEKYLEMCETADDATFIRYMREIAVFGCYIKRKSNLVLVSNEENSDLYKEIQLAYREILNNVSKDNVECSSRFIGESKLTIDVSLVMMDLLESVLELSLPLISKLILITNTENGAVRQTICLTMNDGIKIRESFFKECFDKWEQVIEDNFLGQLDLENEDNDFIISMFIPAGKEDEA